MQVSRRQLHWGHSDQLEDDYLYIFISDSVYTMIVCPKMHIVLLKMKFLESNYILEVTRGLGDIVVL